MLEAETPRAGRTFAAAILVVAVLSAMLMALQPVRTPDIWHHIKSGWLVTQQGSAQTDPFSCTAQGQRWIQYEWLAQLALYGVWKAGGVTGLMVMQVGMIGLTALLLLLAVRTRWSALPALSPSNGYSVRSEHSQAGWGQPAPPTAYAAAAVAVALAMCVASDRIFTRPELFSWVIIGIWLIALEKLRGGSLRWVAAFPVLMALWVNLHGAWPAGLALLGLYCGAETILLLLRRPSAVSGRTVSLLWGALGLAFIATMANPYGMAIWEVPFKLSRSPEVRGAIAEWRKTGWPDILDLRNVGMAVLLMALILAPRALKLRDLFALLFFGALAVTARRHVALAMLIVAPMLASLLAAAWAARRTFTTECAENTENGKSDIRNQKSEIGNGASLCPPFSFFARPVVATLVVAVSCLLLAYVALGFRLERAGAGLKKGVYPIAAADFLARNKLDGNLFNSYAYGNYLLFARYPENRVFIDGRVDMYGAGPVKLYDQVRLAKPGWQDVLAKHGVTLCVLELNRTTDEGLLRALYRSADWALVFWDADSAVFVQRSPERAQFLRTAQVWHFLPGLFSPDAAASQKELSAAGQEFRRKLEEDPACVPALFALARVETALGRSDIPLALLQKGMALEPDNPSLHYEIGALMMERDLLPEAEKAFRRAIALGGHRGSAHLAISVIRNRQKDLTGAIREARAAAAFDPKNWKIYWNLSLFHEQQGNLNDALADMDKVLEIAPSTAAQARRDELKTRITGGAQR